MTWLGINPDSEPLSSVEVVAKHFCIYPEDVTPEEMAIFYNQVDPTLCGLTVSPEPAPRYGDEKE